MLIRPPNPMTRQFCRKGLSRPMAAATASRNRALMPSRISVRATGPKSWTARRMSRNELPQMAARISRLRKSFNGMTFWLALWRSAVAAVHGRLLLVRFKAVAEGVDPVCGGYVVIRADGAVAAQAVGDVAGQLLAVFDAPLVKGVDAPDQRLHKHLVFIKRQQGTKRIGRQAGQDNQVGRAAAGMGAMAGQPL